MKTILGITLAGLIFTGTLQSQTSIDWSHVNSGGGAAGGGGTLVNGSLGGIAIGTSAAGVAVNDAGFWAGVPMPVFSALPSLSIQLIDGSKLQLSWPVTAEGFTLERATVLNPPDWQTVQIVPEIDQGEKIVREEAIGTGFYQLKKE